ncbi:MAG: response regulator [Pedobacter sp.]
MSIKILLADDSITIQKVISIIFGGDDYTLTVVDNGKTAIDKARELSPDVLLIDAIMPGMSGYEVCEVVRATPALATKPILILTGSFEPFDEAKAKSCGADDFLAKPFESQQIVNKVKELYELGVSRTAAQPLTMPIPALPTIVVPPVILQETPVISGQFMEEQAEDIWGAFTVAEEPAPVAPPSLDITESAFEPDVFAIISEEPEVRIAQPPVAPTAPVTHTGSQWVPVEEHTFEYTEEAVAELPATVFSDQLPPITEVAFGDISLEEEPLKAAAQGISTPLEAPVFTEAAPVFADTIIPAFTETAVPAFVAPVSGSVEPAAATIAHPAETSIAATLTEEQLKAAIAGVSQEVIQRIVWEVVPDLAESLIKEAIRKIREGM